MHHFPAKSGVSGKLRADELRPANPGNAHTRCWLAERACRLLVHVNSNRRLLLRESSMIVEELSDATVASHKNRTSDHSQGPQAEGHRNYDRNVLAIHGTRQERLTTRAMAVVRMTKAMSDRAYPSQTAAEKQKKSLSTSPPEAPVAPIRLETLPDPANAVRCCWPETHDGVDGVSGPPRLAALRSLSPKSVCCPLPP